jgi:hypothetical protein
MRLELSDISDIEWLVKKLRSQDKAAKAIGVSERTLGRYRNGLAAPANEPSLDGFRSALRKALKRYGKVKP